MNNVLIISNNCLNTYNNMGQTLTRLFESFDRKELTQLYFYNQDPDIDKCSSFYRITDVEALKSIILRKSYGSERVYKQCKEKSSNKNILKVTRTPIQLLLRDFVWKLSQWNNKKLNDWIKRNKSNCIFFAAGDCKFTYNIALKISKKYNIPIVTYFCDDYYTENLKEYNFIEKFYRKCLNLKIKELIKKSYKVICISESLKKKYDRIFNINCDVIMTPYDTKIEKEYVEGEPIKITYIGNLSLNRWNTILKVGHSIEKINKEKERIILNVYSDVKDEKIKQLLSNQQGINFKGKINPENVMQEYEKSDILLHVESFDKKDSTRVKHSISTKIANYLISNRCILAIGAKGIESIEYLRRNNAAYIIDDEEKIYELCLEYFIENKIDKQIIKNSRMLAEKNHQIEKNSVRLKEILSVKKKLDICFIGGIFPPNTEENVIKNSKISVEFAANKFQYALINGFLKNNLYKFTILNSMFINSFPRGYKKLLIKTSQFKLKNSEQNHINVGFINLYYFRYFFKYLSLKKYLKKWCKDQSVDVEKVIIGYTNINPNIKLFKYSKRKYPNIRTHLIIPDIPNMCINRKKIYNIFLRRNNNELLKNKKYIDTYTLLTKQMGEYLHIDEKDFTVVEGILDNKEEKLKEEKKFINTIFYSGTLNKRYGIIDLLDAFNLITDKSYRLILCGAGDCVEEINERAKNDKRIRYLGVCKNEEVIKLQKQATVLVNPRKNDEEYTKYSFPSKTIEYLNSGTPLLAYKLDGIPNEYDDYIIYINNNSVKELSDKIIETCSLSLNELNEKGRKNKEFIVENKNSKIQTYKIIKMIIGEEDDYKEK